MGRVRSQGNRSTEWRLRSALARSRIRGWRMQARDTTGVPDVLFEEQLVAVFVDGCFWHGCPKCKRTAPKANRSYWKAKIRGNITRRRAVARSLHRAGLHVLTVWEHDLRSPAGIARILARLNKLGVRPRMPPLTETRCRLAVKPSELQRNLRDS